MGLDVTKCDVALDAVETSSSLQRWEARVQLEQRDDDDASHR